MGTHQRSTGRPRWLSCAVASLVILGGCIGGLDAGTPGKASEGRTDLPEPTSGAVSGEFATIVAVSHLRRNVSDAHVEFTATFPETPRNLSFWTRTGSDYRCDSPEDASFASLTARYRDARRWSVVVDKGPVDVSRHQRFDAPPAVEDAIKFGDPVQYHWETVPPEGDFFARFNGTGPLVSHDIFILGADAAPGMTWTVDWTNTTVEVESWQARTFAYDQADFASDDQIQAGLAGHTVKGQLQRDIGRSGDHLWLGLAPRRLGATYEASEPGTLHYEGPGGINGTTEDTKQAMYDSATGSWTFGIEESTEPIGRQPIVYGASWPWSTLCDEPGFRSS